MRMEPMHKATMDSKMINRGKALIVAIDPDVGKSGIAIRNNEQISLKSMHFWELCDWIVTNADHIGEVRIECGYLNAKANWHSSKSAGVSSRVGTHVGANHQVSRLLVQLCRQKLSSHNIVTKEIKPLKKQWKGAGGKISHAELVSIFNYREKKATNQEERDAYLLVL